MRKFVFFSILIAFLTLQTDLFAQVNSGKSVRLPKSQNFLAKTVVPKISEVNVKWEESFNTTTQPSDWIVIDNDNSGLAFTFEQQIDFQSGDQVLPQAGQSFWFSDYTGANNRGLIDEWLISPQLPAIADGDSLILYAGAIDGDYKDSLKVLISTTNQSPGSWNLEQICF